MAALACALAGCTTTRSAATYGGVTEISDIRTAAQYHTVASGEGMMSIARRYSLDVDALASANGLSRTAMLEKGQVLVIPRRTAKRRLELTPLPSRKESFSWPVNGPILTAFGARVDKTRNKGIDIRVSDGERVHASRSGTVVYCDDKMKGFGKTIIIDHGDSFQSVYAYNSRILVRVGDVVRKGDVIATAGNTGRAREPTLHFEIRKNGESRNPVAYLN